METIPDMISYSIPVPIVVIFGIINFAFARQYIPMLIAFAGFASTVSYQFDFVLMKLYFKPIGKSVAGSTVTVDRNQVALAKRRLLSAPAVESFTIIGRWLMSPILFLSIPYFLLNRIDVIEFTSMTVLTLLTGLISFSFTYQMTEQILTPLLSADIFRRAAVGKIGEYSTAARQGITLLFRVLCPSGLFVMICLISPVAALINGILSASSSTSRMITMNEVIRKAPGGSFIKFAEQQSDRELQHEKQRHADREKPEYGTAEEYPDSNLIENESNDERGGEQEDESVQLVEAGNFIEGDGFANDKKRSYH
jgi:hypothetical protein